MGEKIVVFGGTGLIGTHLCLRLLDSGNDVFCVDIRNPSDSSLLRGACDQQTFHYIDHNITNRFTIRCNEIYNLTAPTRLHYDRNLPVEILKINILGSINTLESARMEQAKILYASSDDVYGAPCRESISEERNLNAPKYILAEGKRAGEAFHRAYSEEHGVDTRIARIFNTYGPGAAIEDQRVVMKMIVAALRNQDIRLYGSGEQLRTFCWVGDIVDGLIKLMQAPPAAQTRTVNLGGSHEIPIRALAEKIISITGSRSRILHSEIRFDDPRRRMPDLTAAKRELDWTPVTPLLEGLKRTVDYAETELSRMTRAGVSWVEINS